MVFTGNPNGLRRSATSIRAPVAQPRKRSGPPRGCSYPMSTGVWSYPTVELSRCSLHGCARGNGSNGGRCRDESRSPASPRRCCPERHCRYRTEQLLPSARPSNSRFGLEHVQIGGERRIVPGLVVAIVAWGHGRAMFCRRSLKGWRPEPTRRGSLSRQALASCPSGRRQRFSASGATTGSAPSQCSPTLARGPTTTSPVSGTKSGLSGGGGRSGPIPQSPASAAAVTRWGAVFSAVQRLTQSIRRRPYS